MYSLNQKKFNYFERTAYIDEEKELVRFKAQRIITSEGYEVPLVDIDPQEYSLSDKPRPGCPGKFTAEQICQIMNAACETPEESGLPLSHWTLSELASELVRRKIVESISTSQLCVFLKSGRNKAAQDKGMDSYPDRR
jgi:hypothetical protein